MDHTCSYPAHAMRVHGLSGEEVASLSVADVTEITAAYGSSMKSLKQHLHALLGVPVRRQRLLCNGNGNMLVSDQAPLASDCSQCFQLVIVPFRTATTKQLKALQRAAALDQAEEMDLLLQMPLHPDCVDHHERTALGVASSHGSETCVRLLLEAGADKDKATDLFGGSPLWTACKTGHLEIARLLLEAGADKDKPAISGTTPLWVAAVNGHLEILRVLLLAGADKDRANNETGASPLFVACAQGHVEVARLLLCAGAGKDTADVSGVTPLWTAARHAHLEIVRLLIEAAADMDHSNNFGASPLWIASARGHGEVVELLVLARADTAARNKQGETPFWVASKGGHLHVTRVLLEPAVDRAFRGFERSALQVVMWPVKVIARHLVIPCLLSSFDKLVNGWCCRHREV